MDRLLSLRLDGRACQARAWFNGVPLADIGPGRECATVPVHEFAVAGTNRLELVVVQATAGDSRARLRLLLTATGHPVDAMGAADATTLASIYGHPPQARRAVDIALPLRFPRWRWLDAAPAAPTPALLRNTRSLLQGLIRGLAEGDSTGLLAATRLRTEEIATAYGLGTHAATQRLREALAAWHADGLRWCPLADDAPLVLSPVAGGRLFECLDADGGPVLRTDADALGTTHALPLRVASVEDRPHVLR